MKNKKVAVPVMIIVTLLFIGLTIFTFVNKGKNKDTNVVDPGGVKMLDSDVIAKKISVSGLKVYNAYISVNNGLSTYGAIVTNTTTEEISVNDLVLIITIDKDIIETKVLRNIEIAPGEELPVMAYFDRELTGLTNIEYELR